MEGGRCQRHPRHRQATGVCPYCLRECLFRLPHHHHHHHPSTTADLRSSSVSSSPCSSDDDAEVSSSEDSSPIHRHSPKSTARASFLFRAEICAVASGLTRSQSLVFFEADGRKEGKEEEGGEKGKEKAETEKSWKKGKVWWKLMSGSRRWWNNKKESRGVSNLMHSQTFKEKSSAKWVLFV
ncbi:uncharacterized protein LOC141828390 [Curcuma longa]|uniref:uncharacterized protein LOC141828390 n=1 Tax=Curcuma longa TaxID=136217 RepID=UPI003D9DDCFE